MVILFQKMLGMESQVDGWTSLMLIVIFFGGVQLLTVGILGIYTGKIFIESKQRPRYIVDELGL